jgi:hypothetical protein
LCIHFRQLNKPTIKNKYPLPIIDDFFDQIRGAKIFSKIDLRSRYHKVRIKEEGIHKTTFRRRYGHYEFVVVPFGFSNAPVVFMCLMNGIFRNYLDKFVIVFRDEIIVYSKSKKEHENQLRFVLQVLREHRLYSKLSEFSFYQEHIHYLGHIISKHGIEVDPENIESIKGWPTPTNVSEIRYFMGLVGYYRIFVACFSKISHPITFLQKKGIKFECTAKCEENFNSLKELLTSAPILKIVDQNENFVVCRDVCKEGVGGVLTQNGNFICYKSKKLKENERNYSTHKMELVAIIIS